MKTTSPPSASTVPPESVATRAHALWEASGCPVGRDLEFWFEAERQLQSVPPSAAADTASARRTSYSQTVRSVEGLGEKTEEMLRQTVPTKSGSPTALDLGPR